MKEEKEEKKQVGSDEEEEEDHDKPLDPLMMVEGIDMTKGAKLTFTYKEGLIVQILPNGDVVQINQTN